MKSRSKSVPKLSVIIPAYKHAQVLKENLPLLLNFLALNRISSQVIICDDGSNDAGQTEAVAKVLGCDYLSLPLNLGKGAAVRMGMLQARGKSRIFTDADIPFEPQALEQMLWYLTHKNFHLVVGDRNLPQSSYFTKVPLVRRLGSGLYSQFVSLLLAERWHDTQCGLKGFQASVAEDLFSVCSINGFGFDVELIHIALKRHYSIKRLPVQLRNQGPSSVHVIRDGVRLFWDLGAIGLNELNGKYALHSTLNTAEIKASERPLRSSSAAKRRK